MSIEELFNKIEDRLEAMTPLDVYTRKIYHMSQYDFNNSPIPMEWINKSSVSYKVYNLFNKPQYKSELNYVKFLECALLAMIEENQRTKSEIVKMHMESERPIVINFGEGKVKNDGE